MTHREFRIYRQTPPPEIRSTDTGSTLVAYAANYNRLSQNLGGFVEQIDPSAFNDSIGRVATGGINVMGLGNHNVDWLLATTDSGTLTLESDSTGLRYTMSLDMTDPDAMRMAAKVQTGKMRGSSFSFRTLPDGDSWSTTEQGFPLRTLLSVGLFDVGPVSQPAYRSTEEAGSSVALRSLSQFIDLPLAQVVEAAQANTLTGLILRDLGQTEIKETDADGPGETAPDATQRGRRNPPTR